MAFNKGIIYITKANYLALITAGTIVSNAQYYITDLDTVSISNANMTLALTTESVFYTSGQVFVCSDSGTYLQGHLYQYNTTEWTDITPSITSLINGSVTILNPQTSLTVSQLGTYIVMGDCGALTVSTTAPVTITILGTLGNLTLPASTGTVLLKSTDYTGSLDLTVAENNVSLKAGSIVGAYQIRCISVV